MKYYENFFSTIYFLGVIAINALVVWLFQGLWNLVIPGIFGLKEISYWQALGLAVILWFIFGFMRSDSKKD